MTRLFPFSPNLADAHMRCVPAFHRSFERRILGPMRPKKTILCVDDNEQALSVRKFMLETRGYRVLTAVSSEQALELFREGGIDLVLSDLIMPYMDGNELIRRMKELAPEVPAILISGSVKAFDRANRADAFLPKGACSPVEMLERIRVMVARKRGPKKGHGLRPCWSREESRAPARRRPATRWWSALNSVASYNQHVQPIIAAKNVSKIYRAGKVHVPALTNVSFVVPPGEFVSIVGPSGSGKSTLFYILGGLTRATSGSVLIDGIDFAQLSDSRRTELRKTKIGFVFQKFNLLPTLTARGNIEIAREIAGSHRRRTNNCCNHLTDMLGIAGRLDHRPAELSGGEQQRVAIARALITRPAIILADEPTGNLDTANSDAVLQMLRRSNQEFKQTVLMITHNPEAAAIGDRILHMRDGRLLDE